MNASDESITECQPRLLSATLGRERWEIKSFQFNQLICSFLANTLKTKNGVINASVNPTTGRVLIFFDVDHWPKGGAELLYSCLEKTAERFTQLKISATQDKQQKTEKTVDKSEALMHNLSALPAFMKEVNGGRPELKPLVGLSCINALMKISVPLLAGVATARTVTGGMPALAAIGLTSPLSQLALLMGGYFALTTAEGIVEHHRVKKWTEYANAIEHELRSEAMDHIQKMDTKEQRRLSQSELTSIVDNEMTNLRNFIITVPHSVIHKSLTFSIATVGLAIISPAAMILALAPIPLIHKFTKKSNAETQNSFTKKTQEKGLLRGIVDDNIQGLNTIKEYTTEEFELEQFRASSDEYRKQSNIAEEKASYWSSGLKLGLTTSMMVPVIYSAFQVMTERQSFTSFSIQSAFLPSLIMATQGIHGEITLFQSAKHAFQRFNELKSIEPTILNDKLGLTAHKIKGELVLENISFGYQDDKAVIRNISMTIPPGKITGLVGTTGSGKSTLIRLLMRHYDVDKGSIRLDGHPVNEFNVTELRKNISVVSQDVHLFNRSVADNIRYGKMDATDQEVAEAARKARALEFIEHLPEGFNTKLGNDGATLSGGQRQRLSLARAILKDAPILILDEATSSVDNATEFEIQRNIINQSQKQNTVIVIAHRLSTVRDAHRIHVIEEGKVIESGNHEQLLKRDGHYAKLWSLQIDKKEHIGLC